MIRTLSKTLFLLKLVFVPFGFLKTGLPVHYGDHATSACFLSALFERTSKVSNDEIESFFYIQFIICFSFRLRAS